MSKPSHTDLYKLFGKLAPVKPAAPPKVKAAAPKPKRDPSPVLFRDDDDDDRGYKPTSKRPRRASFLLEEAECDEDEEGDEYDEEDENSEDAEFINDDEEEEEEGEDYSDDSNASVVIGVEDEDAAEQFDGAFHLPESDDEAAEAEAEKAEISEDELEHIQDVAAKLAVREVARPLRAHSNWFFGLYDGHKPPMDLDQLKETARSTAMSLLEQHIAISDLYLNPPPKPKRPLPTAAAKAPTTLRPVMFLVSPKVDVPAKQDTRNSVWYGCLDWPTPELMLDVVHSRITSSTATTLEQFATAALCESFYELTEEGKKRDAPELRHFRWIPSVRAGMWFSREFASIERSALTPSIVNPALVEHIGLEIEIAHRSQKLLAKVSTTSRTSNMSARTAASKATPSSSSSGTSAIPVSLKRGTPDTGSAETNTPKKTAAPKTTTTTTAPASTDVHVDKARVNETLVTIVQSVFESMVPQKMSRPEVLSDEEYKKRDLNAKGPTVPLPAVTGALAVHHIVKSRDEMVGIMDNFLQGKLDLTDDKRKALLNVVVKDGIDKFLSREGRNFAFDNSSAQWKLLVPYLLLGSRAMVDALSPSAFSTLVTDEIREKLLMSMVTLVSSTGLLCDPKDLELARTETTNIQAELDASVADYMSFRKQKDDELAALRTAKDAELADLRAKLAAKDAEIASKNAEIASKDAEIEELKPKVQEDDPFAS